MGDKVVLAVSVQVRDHQHARGGSRGLNGQRNEGDVIGIVPQGHHGGVFAQQGQFLCSIIIQIPDRQTVHSLSRHDLRRELRSSEVPARELQEQIKGVIGMGDQVRPAVPVEISAYQVIDVVHRRQYKTRRAREPGGGLLVVDLHPAGGGVDDGDVRQHVPVPGEQSRSNRGGLASWQLQNVTVADLVR
ncbi:MAG: hypothetical protein A4E30_01654 [Methanomassiliicoccales archaeon PtaB.Bin215]|nr:MAG: hypothetical protein A4E30_01654 [Methanomassiliicoccales archaeon PtaB.Bin215]